MTVDPPAAKPISVWRRLLRLIGLFLGLCAVAGLGGLVKPPLFHETVNARYWTEGQEAAETYAAKGPQLLREEPLLQPLEHVGRWLDSETGLPMGQPSVAGMPDTPSGGDRYSAFIAGFNNSVRWTWTDDERAARAATLRARVPSATDLHAFLAEDGWAPIPRKSRLFLRADKSLSIQFEKHSRLAWNVSTVFHARHPEPEWMLPVQPSAEGATCRVVPNPADPIATLLLVHEPGKEAIWAFDLETHTLLLAVQCGTVVFPPDENSR